MTIEPSNFLNGHGQNNHFDHQMVRVRVKWSKLTDISTMSPNFNNFNIKKFGGLEIVMIKFGLTILTMKIMEFEDGHGQNWLDHFNHRTSILAKWSKIRGHRTPPPPNYRRTPPGQLSMYGICQV
jgi:phosphatidate phosphatase PAH1